MSAPPGAGASLDAIAAICIGKIMRMSPTTSDSQPMTVTTTGQPVQWLWKYTIASPGTKAA